MKIISGGKWKKKPKNSKWFYKIRKSVIEKNLLLLNNENAFGAKVKEIWLRSIIWNKKWKK